MTSSLVFFGTETHSLIALKHLVESGFNVTAVITKPDSRQGRGHKITEPPVKQYAQSKNISVWQPDKLIDIKEMLINLKPTAGVLVAYGKIIPQSIIDIFPAGIINLHPSLLPKYRGPSPIEAAILSQDNQTGVSIMALDAAMDAGPVYYQEVHPLSGQESRQELYDKLFNRGSELLVANLPGIINGELQAVPQDNTTASYCSLLSKDDAWLDAETMTADNANAHVRAYLGFPGSRTILYGHEVIITEATSSASPTELSIEFCDGNYLAVSKLKPIGKKEMPARAFLAGYKK